jgi:hypothetical protein
MNTSMKGRKHTKLTRLSIHLQQHSPVFSLVALVPFVVAFLHFSVFRP